MRGVVQGERRGDMSGSNLKLCSAGRVDKKERESLKRKTRKEQEVETEVSRYDLGVWVANKCRVRG